MQKIIIAFILSATAASAQTVNDAYIISQERSVTILPLYQNWSIGGRKFSELSLPVFSYVSLNRSMNLTFWGSYAAVRGEALQKLNGLTDTQLAFNYYWEQRRVLLSLRLNAPSGVKGFTPDEFFTSTQLSYSVFNFQVPVLGEGFNIAPAFTWAIPVSEKFVAGLGASYQFKGAYSPLAGIDDYKPGNELLFTGGFDVRVSPATMLSGDVIFTAYAADKIGAVQSFDSGNKLVANVQFRQYIRFDEVWLLARYRSKAKNNLPAAGGVLAPETEKTAPNHFEILGHYRRRFNQRFAVRLLIDGRFYQETVAAFDGINLLGFGLGPEISFSPRLQATGRFKYFAGKFSGNDDRLSGWEAGAGLGVKF